MSDALTISDLVVSFDKGSMGRKQTLNVLDGLSLTVHQGETLCVVGESGSGKSTLANAIVGLVKPVSGSITFQGAELVGLRGAERRRLKSEIQMVFQNPLLSLSPRRVVGDQLDEPLRVHTELRRPERTAKIAAMLNQLGLAETISVRYPHELSGGQAQRVALARALLVEPSLMLFDEPTSALDVSVQAGVLNLLRELKDELDLTYVFITHDLGVARHLADRVAVMSSGELVEVRPTSELFADPRHPYTKNLLDSSLGIPQSGSVTETLTNEATP